MDTNEREIINELTGRIIGAAYAVSNKLGCGFLEKLYENALAIELRKQGLAFERQKHLEVTYDDEVIGDYAADIVVQGRVLVELKAVRQLDFVHEAQCINYLKASGIHLCLLMNFARPRVDIRRIING
jgi:GxxExxY protein